MIYLRATSCEDNNKVDYIKLTDDLLNYMYMSPELNYRIWKSVVHNEQETDAFCHWGFETDHTKPASRGNKMGYNIDVITEREWFIGVL